jgi:predicted O-methyltransferase YrrM
MPDDEGMALYQAASAAAAGGLGPIVEIGTYCAKSAVYLGAGCAAAAGTASATADNAAPGALVFSIDHHRGSEELQPGWPHHDPEVVDPGTGRTDTLRFARRTLAEAGLEATVVLVVGESSAIGRWWQAPLSLVFIDGGHSEALAFADYRAWAPKVAPGGVLAVHDVFAEPADGGQAPYQVYCAALEQGTFEAAGERGSLRLLRRTGTPWP